MKKRRAALLAALVLLLTGCASKGGEGSRGIMYCVQGRDATVWLLGSIHIGNEAMYPFGEAIRGAIREADAFVFECDASGAEAARLMRERMPLPEGKRLSAVLSAPTLDKLAKVCEHMNTPMDAYEGMRPWAVMNTLSLTSTAARLQARDVGEAVALGVERQVERQRAALNGGAPVLYLESVEAQLNLMDGMSAELQDHLLAGTCDAILDPDGAAGMEGDIRQWPDWWRLGDADSFARSYRQSMEAPGSEALTREYHALFVTRRNEAMASYIAGLLEAGGGKRYFVTVGLMHLVLPGDSVIERLRDRGYAVVSSGPDASPLSSSAKASPAGMGLAQ